MSIILLNRQRLILFLSLSGLVIIMWVLIASTPPVTPVLSYAVANRVIVIDPGHGGIDPGAIGHGKVVEKQINLAIASKLQRFIAGAGGMVVMTRTTDKDLSSGSGSFIKRKREDLAARVKIATGAQADLYLAIHCNAEVNPRWRGAQVFYSRGGNESRLMAQHIQHQIKTQLKNTHRQAKTGRFFVTDRTPMKAVLVEVGFLSNYDEERLLSDPEYQSQLAYAIFSGLAGYYAGQPMPKTN
ncbi:MAG: N-acetylmuramoyl-L-alanine amidase family protein [Methanomassiliicoccales archaeon]